MPPHPPFIELPDPEATLLARTRARYEAGEITATKAAQALGFSRSTLTKRITHKWFWRVPQRLAASKARRTLREVAKIASKRAKSAVALRPISRSETSPRALHRMIMVEIARLMRAIQANVDENGLPKDPERHVKMTSALVKLQADAVRLHDVIKSQNKERSRDAAADAANPDASSATADLARLRADLAQKLGEAQPGEADEAAGEFK
jgi:hypothetical protein